MAKKTKKYLAACSVLGIDDGSGIPNTAVYAMLELNGYVWVGGQWVDTRPPEKLEALEMRLVGSKDAVERWAQQVSDGLFAMGAQDIKVSQAYKNRKHKTYRVYVNWREASQ